MIQAGSSFKEVENPEKPETETPDQPSMELVQTEGFLPFVAVEAGIRSRLLSQAA